MSSNPETDVDVEALLVEVEALRAENARLREQLQQSSSSGAWAEEGGDVRGGAAMHPRAASSLSEAANQSAAAAAANASVRRKKDIIDSEQGKAAYRAPHVSSFRNLFNRSDVLHFEEDSPTFRLKMDELEESVDELRVFAQQLVDSCRHYCKHGNASVEAGREFAGLLSSLRSEAWTQRFGKVAPLLAIFGDTFEEIESYREVLLSSLEETFCAPMEEFVRREVKCVRHMKQDVQKASADLEASLGKYLRHRQGAAGAAGGGAPEPQEKWDAELSVLRQSFELTRYDILVELNSQKTNRKFQLCQRVCTALYAHLGFFQECHNVIDNVEPAMDQLNTELALARKEYSNKGMLYNLKRKLLLREVKRSSPALALLLPKKKRGSFQSDVIVSPQPFVSHPPSSLIPALGQDVLRRPSLDSILARRHSEVAPGRRPSADSALSVATIQFTVPTNDPPSVKKSILWDDINGAADAQNDISPPLLRECQGSPKRAPLFGQVGELEGLRMSQCLISRVLSDELEGGGSGSPSDGKGDADQSGHFRARSDSSDPCGPRVRRMNSNAGEIISTAAVTLTKVTKVDEFEEGRSRTMSISAHSLYSDASKGAQKSKIRMQGYLWKQSNNIARDWQRRWFIIENGQLWYMQTDIGGNKPLIGAGIVSGVTSAASRDPTLHSRLVQAVERKLVISPGKRVYVLQAESLESYIAWVSALRSEIEISLSKVLTHDAHSSQSANGNSLSPNFGQVRMVSDERDGEDQFTIVLSDGQQEALRRINKNCADCGQEGPEWASVNNGIMICIQCCGVHRSLGTHISKVRSLRLDRWTPNSVQLLVEIGNSRFNAIYERALRDGTVSISRLSKDSSRDVIISFITAKYVEHKFVGTNVSKHVAEENLIAAAEVGHLLGIMEAIGAGADVNARTADAHLLSALHYACKGGHALAVELLCQMNARVDITDAIGKTPSDYIDNDNVAVIDTLYSNVEIELNSYTNQAFDGLKMGDDLGNGQFDYDGKVDDMP